MAQMICYLIGGRFATSCYRFDRSGPFRSVLERGGRFTACGAKPFPVGSCPFLTVHLGNEVGTAGFEPATSRV